MSNDSEHNEAIGEEVPLPPRAEPDQTRPRVQRRLSVYFSYGEGHTFILEEGDQVIDPLIPPEGADPGWVPNQIDIDVPKLILVKQVADPNGAPIVESIYLKHVAYTRYIEYTIKPKPKQPANMPVGAARRPGPQFRDTARRGAEGRRESLPPPVGKDPVKV